MPYVDGSNVQHLLEITRCVYTDTKGTMAFDSVRRSVSMTLRVRQVDAYRRGATVYPVALIESNDRKDRQCVAL
jgi:hypothetical protein